MKLGKYQIHEELGCGAFATVYRALDTTLDREVALKILHPQLLTDPTFVERFKREARAMANLDHQHIATLYEIGEAEERVYIAMQLARGLNLGEAIAEQGCFSWEQALALLRPVCEALDYAHSQNVVHRDLKPSNVLLAPEGDRGPMLTDFGFARLMGDSSVSLSLSGDILGTPAYIAPEVWELDKAEPPADVYALGCILYEVLTGEVLFAGRTPMQSMRAHDQRPQLPQEWQEDVPAGIETVLEKALARDPAERYDSGMALWHGLKDLEAQAQTAKCREETETAMANSDWIAAKVAVARWLVVAPNDHDAKEAWRKIEQQLKGEFEREKKEKEPFQIKESTGSKSVPSRFKLLGWIWAIGGMALLALMIYGVLGVSRNSSATPTQTPWPTPESVEVYDRFNNNDTGWGTGMRDRKWCTGTVSITDGKYIWVIKETYKGHLNRSTPIKAPNDFYVSVDAQLITGPEDTACYNLVYREHKTGFYKFKVCDDQYYEVHLQYKDDWKSLINWTNSSAIRPGEVNKLAVNAVGNHFEFFINDQFVGYIDDDTLSGSGDVGVAITVAEGDVAIIEFDHFVLREP